MVLVIRDASIRSWFVLSINPIVVLEIDAGPIPGHQPQRLVGEQEISDQTPAERVQHAAHFGQVVLDIFAGSMCVNTDRM